MSVILQSATSVNIFLETIEKIYENKDIKIKESHKTILRILIPAIIYKDGKIIILAETIHQINRAIRKTNDNDKFDFSKIVILINNNSASGAEALSAALNENLGDVVDLVGVTTYGKGSAQKTIYFTDGTYTRDLIQQFCDDNKITCKFREEEDNNYWSRLSRSYNSICNTCTRRSIRGRSYRY